jgi:outer membrane protein TolC
VGISRQVHEALLDFTAADQNVRMAELAVASADEDYRLALVRYQAGKAINLEPIEALSALVRARTNYAQALFAQRVALDEVNHAVGHLPL